MMAKAKKMSGFTMLETIIVIVILVIIAVVSIPKIIGIADYRVNIAKDKIIGDMRFAQGLAMNKVCHARIAFNVAGNSYTISDNSSGSYATTTDPWTKGNFTVLLNSGSYSGVTFTSVSFDGQITIEFDSNGKPYSYNGSTATALAATGTVVLLPGPVTVSVTPQTGKAS